MRKISLFTLLIIAVQVSAQKVQTPDQIYGVLFKDVQMAKIFPDGKTFVDCVPKRNPKEIVKDYLAVKNNPAIRFSLQLFIEANFELPKTPQLNYITQEKDVVMHIKNLWNVLKRDADKPVEGSSLLPLALSLYRSRWPFQRSLLLGFLFYHAGIKRKRGNGNDREHGQRISLT